VPADARNSGKTDLSAVNIMELYARLLDRIGRASDTTKFSARAASNRGEAARPDSRAFQGYLESL
jgi:hypothetical protein